MSIDKVELGRRLFYDNRLSINGRGSCGSCHQQQLAFTDGRANAIGVTGELHPRSSMTLVNVAYNINYTWASRELRTLEQQIRIPLFNEQPIELGLRGSEALLVERLEGDEYMHQLFRSAFAEAVDPVSVDSIVKAIAAFVRTIISAESAFDRRLYEDDETAMSTSATRGMQLFYSADLQCGECHAGRDLNGDLHNTGLYNIDQENRYPSHDTGLRMETDELDDDGRFRAPTLRNIALTAPYMHDGSIATLAEVVDHYAVGGRSNNAKRSPLLVGFTLSEEDKMALLSFLESLTDTALLDNPRFAPPVTDMNCM